MPPPPSRRGEGLAVAAILVLAAVLNVAGGGFPPELHPDEMRKAEFVLAGTQDFKHPILLLQLVRGLRWLAPTDDPTGIVAIGRGVSATAGLALLVFAHLLLRRSVGVAWAIVGTMLLAVSPILVVHAHYCKEDVLLTAACLAALLALCRFVEARPGAAAWLGIALGLACSAHYKGVLVVVIALAAPALVAVGETRRYYRRLLAALAVAGLVFGAVNVPMLGDPAAALAGARFEMAHARGGHHVVIGGRSEWWSFHLRESLVPGLGGIVVLLAAAGLVAAAGAWGGASPATRLVLAFGALAYAVVELSPLKPYPDFMRYVLPVVPAMVLSACLALRALETRLAARGAGWIVGAVALVAVALPAVRSVRLVRHLADDSRVRAEAWLREHDARALRELYAGRRIDGISVADVDLVAARRSGVTHVVTTSFLYERMQHGATLASPQPSIVYEYAEKYRRLFALPYVEIPPAYMTFAFSDPTVRIVDIRGAGGGDPGGDLSR